MAALARAVAVLLFRGGWLVGLVFLEALLLAGFWWSGPTPFGDAFDRRAAEADFLLLTLSSLPALFAGALLASGDREDGMAAFYRSCGLSPTRQVAGTTLGLFFITGASLATAVVVAVVASGGGGSGGLAVTLSLGLASVAIHGTWGVALGAWLRSRWSAVAAALGFWLVTVLALEGLVLALLEVFPVRWAWGTVLTFTFLDPSELVRVSSVILRGQGWAYGPAFAELREWLPSLPGLFFLVGLVVVHVLVPGVLAVWGWRRRAL